MVETKKYLAPLVFLSVLIALTILIIATTPISAEANQNQSSAGVILPNQHNLQNISVDIKREEIPGFSGGKGQARYNVNLSARIQEGGFPLIYPIRVTYYDTTPDSPTSISGINSSEHNVVESQTIVLSPTTSDTFTPTAGERNSSVPKERKMVKSFNVTLAFDDLTNENGTVTKNIYVVAESQRSVFSESIIPDDRTYDSNVSEVEGPLPAQVYQTEVESSFQVGQATDVSYVDSYRITETNSEVNPRENAQIPTPEEDLSGQLEGFNGMTSPIEGGAGVFATQSGLNLVTLTKSIPAGEPKSLSVLYSQANKNLTVTPINPLGKPISEESNYVLPSNHTSSDNCRQVQVANSSRTLCKFYLNSEETESITRLGELYTQYSADPETAVEINCQSLTTGYLNIDGQSCGVDNGVDSVSNFTTSSYIDFEGKQKSSTVWNTDKTQVSALPDKNVSLDIRLRPRILQDNVSIEHKIAVVSRDELVDGEISTSSNILYTEQFSTSSNDYGGDDSDWENITVDNVPARGLNKQYFAVMCQTGTTIPQDCNLDSAKSSDVKDIKFRKPSTPFDLSLKQPIAIDNLRSSGVDDTFVLRTETLETTDPNYQNDPNTVYNWRKESKVSDSFGGLISYTIPVRGVPQSKIDSGQHLPSGGSVYDKAVDRRPDEVSNSNWDTEFRISANTSDTRYIPQGVDATDNSELSAYVDNPSLWSPVPIQQDRVFTDGSESQYFIVYNKGTFLNVVERGPGWYPLRGPAADSREVPDFRLESKSQRVDPDSCLNCLPTENATQAQKRLSQSVGRYSELISSPSTNTWVKQSQDPGVILPAQETNKSFFRSGENLSVPMVYENLDLDLSEAEDRFRYRESERNFKRIYDWELSSPVTEVKFRRDTVQDVQKIRKNTYDVEYEFSTVVNGEQNLYNYRRDVTQKSLAYEEGQILWVDVSDSEPSDEIDSFSVRFEGSEDAIDVDWIDGIHSVAPYERDSVLSSTCETPVSSLDNNDKYPTTRISTQDISSLNDVQRVGERNLGSLGSAIVQTCEIDGESKIVRVGQEARRTGEFDFRVSMKSGTRTKTESGEFMVQSENESADVSSTPVLRGFRLINDKVDYEIGTIPIAGEIRSPVQRLDSKYEVTVSPADDIDVSSVSCSEIGDYRKSTEYSLSGSFETGESLRQIESCELEGFIETSAAPDNFTIYDLQSDRPSGIPRGAIQRCLQPLNRLNNGDCEATDGLKGLSTTHSFDIGSRGNWNPVSSVSGGEPPLGLNCPNGYNLELGNESIRCNIEGSDADIDLKSRVVSVQYESIPAGIVRECERIPIESEEGNHDGYTTNKMSNRVICEKVDGSDAGPDEFVLSEDEMGQRGNLVQDYKQIPAGAFRGESLTRQEVPNNCISSNINSDGSLICQYEQKNGTIVDVRYASVSIGDWTSSSEEVASLADQTDAEKSIWGSSYIVDNSSGDGFTEKVGTTVNPRSAGFTPEDSPVNLTIRLRDVADGDTLQKETLKVDLCSAKSASHISEIPKSTMGSYECDEFDTMLTGNNDFVSSSLTIDEAVQNYANNHLSSPGSETYIIDSVANDACPYKERYPRNQQGIINNIASYNIVIDADNLQELRSQARDARRKISQQLISDYSITTDNICGFRDETEVGEPIPVQSDSKSKIVIDKNDFVNETSRDFVRIAGMTDLHSIVPNPVQTRWAQDDLGGSLRLGTPVLLKDSDSATRYKQNDNLLAHYPFDHDVTKDTAISGIPSSPSKNRYSVPNHYVIQDVGLPASTNSPDGTESEFSLSDNVDSNGIYNARIWYGTSCNYDGRSSDGEYYHPESIQPIDKGGVSRNARAFDGCDEAMTSRQAISNFSSISGYNTNGIASSISNLPSYYHPDVDDSLDRLDESVLGNQSAHLPVRPKKDWRNNYRITSGKITDAYKAVKKSYKEGSGIFSGNALKLDKYSWLMLSPPCQDKSAVQSGTSVSSYTPPSSCSDISDENWRGGWQNSYTDADKQISGESINQKLSGSSYTISFWVNSESEKNSMENPELYNGDTAVEPYRTLISTGVPADGSLPSASLGGPNYLFSTNQLSLIKTPESISLEGISDSKISSSSVLSGSKAYPSSWDYPGHISLKDTARACMSDYDFSFHNFSTGAFDDTNRPVMCEVFELSQSDHAGTQNDDRYDDLTKFTDDVDIDYSSKEPVFLEDFVKEMEERINWETSYEWPAGNAVERRSISGIDSQGYPNLGSKGQFINGTSGTGCGFAFQRNSLSSTAKKCYTDGRYLYSGPEPTNRSPSADSQYKSSNWQHIAISYDNSASDLVVYVNGRKSGSLPDSINLDESHNRDNLYSGKIYENSILSVGATYQDAGYNLNATTLSNNTADYRPYIHASKGDILIDELRIYDEAYSGSEISQTEIPDVKTPSEHRFRNNIPMYTGEITTERQKISSGPIPVEELSNVNIDVDAKSNGPAAYSIQLVPCNASKCAQSASKSVFEQVLPSSLGGRKASGGLVNPNRSNQVAESSDSPSSSLSLSGTSLVTKFDTDELNSSGISQVDSFKTDIQLGSPYLTSSPVIDEITIETNGDLYSDCQDIGRNHPGSDGMYGHIMNTTIEDKEGLSAKVRCDMRRSGGGWTRFAWMGEQGSSYNYSPGFTIDIVDGFFAEEQSLSDCSLNDEACFPSLEFNSSSTPQIMVAAVNNTDVVNWATFQLNEQVHKVTEPDRGIDNIQYASDMASALKGERIYGDVLPRSQIVGPELTNLRDSEKDLDGEYRLPECVFAFDSGERFDSGCASHVAATQSRGATETVFKLQEWRVEELSAGTTERLEKNIVEWSRVDSSKTIKENVCLGQDVDENGLDRCEIYYRYGDGFK